MFAEQRKRECPRRRFVARSGDHVGAAATIAELLKTPASGGEEKWFYWNAALAYAQCALALKGDDQRRVAYEEKGVAMLRKAVAAGLDYGPFRQLDPDIHPLRDRADFQQIVTDLKSRHQPPRELAPPPREKK